MGVEGGGPRRGRGKNTTARKIEFHALDLTARAAGPLRVVTRHNTGTVFYARESKVLMTSHPIFILALLAAAAPEWPQYGGPHRNFTADTKGLAASWPAAGPKQLWKRALGDGYSGIVVDNGKLYTMYRRNNDEVLIAMDAKTGKTLWEQARNAAFRARMGMEN